MDTLQLCLGITYILNMRNPKYGGSISFRCFYLDMERHEWQAEFFSTRETDGTIEDTIFERSEGLKELQDVIAKYIK